jgi:hypothetical protein
VEGILNLNAQSGPFCIRLESASGFILGNCREVRILSCQNTGQLSRARVLLAQAPGVPVRNNASLETESWENKFQGNVERDRHAQQKLQDAGWAVFVIWECQINEIHELVKHLERIRVNLNETR